ncbi:phosphodiester glycosidase family protein [Paenibacillus physcomitrellae]|uniref:phosphodiester glycosidase family protein n=1 Tax=Paenibacillus physcomitrellae TaxID=1619311 RepID=UPI001E57DF2B|nr:phosphodiester glycosidase family protein [Paenibacillus physcomitrellae]
MKSLFSRFRPFSSGNQVSLAGGKIIRRGLLLAAAILLLIPAAPGLRPAEAAGTIQTAVKTVKVSGKSFTVRTVKIPKGTPVTVGLAKHQVGQTEAFASTIKSYKAQAAINGAFFNSYGGPADPYGTLIIKGKISHIGRYGTTIGFQKDGTAIMDTLRPSLTGKVTGADGKPRSWYATFINRTPDAGANNSILFTPDRGPKVGFSGGIAVTVSGGVVTHKGVNGNTAIPKQGYVLVFSGKEKAMADRFEVGSSVEWNVTYTNQAGKKLDWSNVQTAVGAGPRLVTDGKVTLNAKAEGFNDQKILTASAARSGIAILPDGSILLATVNGATMSQWASVMKALGAKQAMNLDGGASSALYGGGKMLTPAGRLLSNTLVFGSQVTK